MLLCLDKRIAHLRQALEDVSVLAHLDGYRPDHLMFVDQLLKELGEFSFSLSFPIFIMSLIHKGADWL